MPQPYNPQLIDQLATDFPRRVEPNFALGNVLAGMKATPKLRGLWGSSADEDGSLVDISGQGRSLHLAGAGTPVAVAQRGLLPYLNFDVSGGATYLQRIGEPGLCAVENQTIWGWFYFDAENTGAEVTLLGIWNAGANRRCYRLWKDANDKLAYSVSDDGMAIVTIDDGGVNYAESTWLFILGRFTKSAELKLYVGFGTTGILSPYTNIVGVPALLFSADDEYFMAGNDADGNNFDGQMSLFGLAEYPEIDAACFNKFHQSRPLVSI